MRNTSLFCLLEIIVVNNFIKCLQNKLYYYCCVDYITADLLSQAADFERLESLVDKTQQDKRRLGVRVNRLTQTGELLNFTNGKC